MKKSRFQFNLAMNKEEYNILFKLKSQYAINISGSFKLFLKQQLEQLERLKKREKRKGM